MWQTPPPAVNRMTDACENINLDATTLRKVTIRAIIHSENHHSSNDQIWQGAVIYTWNKEIG